MRKLFTYFIVFIICTAAIKAADIAQPPTNTSGVIGSEIKIPCIISGIMAGNELLSYYKYPQVGSKFQIATSQGFLYNSTKYAIDTITRKFELSIKDAFFSDDGAYDCVLTRQNAVIQEHKFFLIISDPPKSARIYWPGDLDYVEMKGQPVNLTCKSEKSRPQPSIRWTKNGQNITSAVVRYYAFPPDATGYFEAYSYMELMLQFDNLNDRYECFVEVPGAAPLKQELLVKFSKATTVSSSILAFVITLFILTQI